jgi:MFS family permease
VCFGAFMGQLDASIVTLTYRPLEQQFNVGPEAVQWVSLSYLLTLVTLLVPLGRRSDRKGRKLSYLHGFVVFSVGSAACGLAPGLAVLVGARVLQAVGAALLQANSVALVTRAAPPGRLRAALGWQAAAQALGLALGPTVGGVIVATLGWRWVYAINVPVGLMAITAAVLFLPRTVTRASATSGDTTGSLLFGGGLLAALLALSALGGLAVPAWAVVALIATAGTSAMALARRRRSGRPLPGTEALRVPGALGAFGTALFAYLVLFGPLVLVPSVLIQAGYSSLQAGLILSALPAGFAVAATTSGACLPGRWDDRRRSWLGASVAAAAAAAAALVAAPLHPYVLVPLLGILGLGLGILAPANNAAIMRAVPDEASATAGGLLNMTRGLGTALGICAVTACTGLGGPRLAVGALLAAAALCLACLHLSRDYGRNMPDHENRSSASPGISRSRHLG